MAGMFFSHARAAVKSAVGSVARDKRGVTAVEYGVLAALIIVASIVTIGQIGESLNAAFTTVNTNLQ